MFGLPLHTMILKLHPAVALWSHGRHSGRPLGPSTPPEQTRPQEVAVQAMARAVAQHSAARKALDTLLYLCGCLGFCGRTALLLLVLLNTQNTMAQSCDFVLSGQVIDEHDTEALGYPEIWLPDLGRGIVGDSLGRFEVNNLCAGPLRVVCHHIGCESLDTVLVISGNTAVVFYLEHHTELLQMVEVFDNRYRQAMGAEHVLNGAALEARKHMPLAEALAGLPGISVWQGAGAISKPVVDGLMGVRLSTTVNGTLQEDQQWGNDHAPAFDLLSAGRVRVVRGAAAVLFGPESVGGALDVETRLLPETPLERQQSWMLRSYTNGRGGQLSYQTTKKRPSGAGWVWSGGVNRHGDLHSPDYSLTNTGSFSGGVSGMFRSAVKRWRYESESRVFLNDAAIMRAAHIGNLTDLNTAIGASRPLVVEPFGYLIDAPRQSVQHVSQTFNAVFQPKLELRHRFHASIQWNRRREFDRRRGGRRDVPVLHLQLLTPAAGWQRSRISERGVSEWAVQWQGQFNYNIFGTGFLPLLPDYNQHTVGVARLQRRVWASLGIEAEYGLRADIRSLTKIEPTGTALDRTRHNYFLWAAHMGISKKWLAHQVRLSVSNNRRAPAVAELYARGIHQSVAAYELGSPLLKPELSTKATAEHLFNKNRWSVNQSLFVQYIDGFINLEPLPEPILTIRGAFPAFQYRQHQVFLAGHSAMIQYRNEKNLEISGGHNIFYHTVVHGLESALYYQPASRFFIHSDISYKGWHFSPGAVYQLRQHLAPEGDFLVPPAAYWLAQAGIAYTWRAHRVQLTCHNVFNQQYRDYLSRLRYFADQPGRDVQLLLQFNL
jgi:iron complex outermembrane receptor protein